MAVAIVTGSAGLIGSEAAAALCRLGIRVVGIDNDMRRVFFGPAASTALTRARLLELPGYEHHDIDIRDQAAVERVFAKYAADITLVVHAAGQPSHDWAARDPMLDFEVNATSTMRLLECVRGHSPSAVFIFTSTNKVYGDTPNRLPLIELDSRWEISPSHRYAGGIDESMAVDDCLHSLFGVSKLAADVLVQEYGRYFGLRTATFRCGCLTGPQHAGAELHGFLAYLMKCVCTGRPYTIFGYRGKQVRDNIHCADVVEAFLAFWRQPREGGQVYNLGGSRHSNCSILEAIDLCESIAGKRLHCAYSDVNRVGDHIWYISDISKFQMHYPTWKLRHDMRSLLNDLYWSNVERWELEAV